MVDSFFDNYCPYLNQMQSGHHPQAVNEDIKLLLQIKALSPDRYKELPKGTPFYFLGISAFLSHDFQTAAFLFDSAVSEDLQHYPNRRDTPALLTIQLNQDNKNQAALPIVKIAGQKLQYAIDIYNNRIGSKRITLEEVQSHFFTYVLLADKLQHLRTLTTTFISFLFEWDYRTRLVELCETGSREPFFSHLFRGCLLFESLLKENPKKSAQKTTLSRILCELSSELSIPESLKINSKTFDSIVRSLPLNQSIDQAIVCTGKIRNTLGHNLAWATQSLNATSYNLLAENVAISCLHAISCLYGG